MPRSEIKLESGSSGGSKLFQLLSLMTDCRTGGPGELKEESQQQILPVRTAPRPVIYIQFKSAALHASSLFSRSAQTGCEVRAVRRNRVEEEEEVLGGGMCGVQVCRLVTCC